MHFSSLQLLFYRVGGEGFRTNGRVVFVEAVTDNLFADNFSALARRKIHMQLFDASSQRVEVHSSLSRRGHTICCLL